LGEKKNLAKEKKHWTLIPGSKYIHPNLIPTHAKGLSRGLLIGTHSWGKTSVGLVYRLHSDINSSINMNMKILDQLGMVCSSYCNWNHIVMVCENWTPQLIIYTTGNNILGTLIYIHKQLFMSIDAMVWISTFIGCKVWVVNCKLCCSSTWREAITL
jgi:hypothetical protein